MPHIPRTWVPTIPAQLDADGQLLCPHCGDMYLHQHDELLHQGHPARRGNGISIRFYCEHCSQESERSLVLWITQHKGNTHLEWKV